MVPPSFCLGLLLGLLPLQRVGGLCRRQVLVLVQCRQEDLPFCHLQSCHLYFTSRYHNLLFPTHSPWLPPSHSPTLKPSMRPSTSPTSILTQLPTQHPTLHPTPRPTSCTVGVSAKFPCGLALQGKSLAAETIAYLISRAYRSRVPREVLGSGHER